MKCLYISVASLILIFLQGCNNTPEQKVQAITVPKVISDTFQQQKISNIDYFDSTVAKIHPKARRLLREDFYWSTTDEFSLFGNDDGRDAFWNFKNWRKNHKTDSTINSFYETLDRWGYRPIDPYTINPAVIDKYISQEAIGNLELMGIDQAIVATGFGQFVIEGKIDQSMKTLTRISIQRQMLPILLDRWGDDYKKERGKYLQQLLTATDSM